MKAFPCLFGLLVTCALVGCGSDLPKTVPVTGTVTLDGKPLEGATVNLISDEGSLAAGGVTDESGNFSLRTTVGDKMVDGAKVGTHKVAVTKTSSSGPAIEMDIEERKKMMEQMTTNPAITSDVKVQDLVPAKYKNPLQSGLVANVTQEGPNQITLELTSK
jgi:hypothetical protein